MFNNLTTTLESEIQKTIGRIVDSLLKDVEYVPHTDVTVARPTRSQVLKTLGVPYKTPRKIIPDGESQPPDPPIRYVIGCESALEAIGNSKKSEYFFMLGDCGFIEGLQAYSYLLMPTLCLALIEDAPDGSFRVVKGVRLVNVF
jgi:hypothetical protein